MTRSKKKLQIPSKRYLTSQFQNLAFSRFTESLRRQHQELFRLCRSFRTWNGWASPSAPVPSLPSRLFHPAWHPHQHACDELVPLHWRGEDQIHPPGYGKMQRDKTLDKLTHTWTISVSRFVRKKSNHKIGCVVALSAGFVDTETWPIDRLSITMTAARASEGRETSVALVGIRNHSKHLRLIVKILWFTMI